MPTIDELGRDAAAALRARMASTIDVDNGLRAVEEAALAPVVDSAARPAGRGWLVAAAAVVVVTAGVGVAVLLSNDDEGTITPASTETVPATTAAPTTIPDTAPPTSPSTTVEPTPTTTPPPSSASIILVPDVGMRLPAPIAPCGERRCDPVVNPSGVFAQLTGPTELTVTAPDGSSRVVPLAQPVDGWLVAWGPDEDVVYATTSAGSGDPVGRLVAYSVAGDNHGEVIAMSEPNLDMSGDSSLVPIRTGLVEVGDVGPGPRPDPAVDQALPWLRWDGTDTTSPGPFTTYDPATRTVTLTDETGSTVGSWQMPEGFLDRGTPYVWQDGAGVVVAGYDWTIGPVFLRLREGGVAQTVAVPDGFSVATWSLPTPILFDGTNYWSWSLPAYTEPQTAELPDGLSDGTYASPDEAVDLLVDVLSDDDGCEAAPNVRVVAQSGEDPVSAIVDYTYGCDDSGAGGRFEVTLGELDGQWVVTSVVHRGLCSRGLGDSFACL